MLPFSLLLTHFLLIKQWEGVLQFPARARDFRILYYLDTMVFEYIYHNLVKHPGFSGVMLACYMGNQAGKSIRNGRVSGYSGSENPAG